MTIEELYNKNCETVSDINEHVPVLKSYYDKCEHVTEFGVRGAVSLSAALYSNAKKVVAYDIYPVAVPESDKLTFICKSSLEIEIEPTDFLFIDSLHTYDQLFSELTIHANNVNKWIGMHDTVSFGQNGEDGQKGLAFAIQDFLASNNQWEIDIAKENNNGLTILKRK
jgi:hypothetical protein